MADKVFQILYEVVYAVELFLVGEGIFHNRVKEKAKYAVMFVIYSFGIVPTVLYADNNFFIRILLGALIYGVLFQGSKLSCIINFGVVYLLTGIVDGVVSSIGILVLRKPLDPFNIVTIKSEAVWLILAVVSLIFDVFMIYRKWVQKIIGYFRLLKWFQCLAVAMITLSGILLLGINIVLLEYIENKKVGMVLFLIAILFIVMAFAGVFLLVFSVYGSDYYLRQNQLKEDIIHMQQMYFQSIYDNDKEMRNFRHDIHSQLGCLQLMLAERKTDQAVAYLETIGNHFQELSIARYHTGSEVLDIVINQKVQEAKKKGITIKIQGILERPNFMDTYDLCALFSNALNNSIEACENIKDMEKVITISIVSQGNSVFFQFTNPATQGMYMALSKGKTTKKDCKNHGFGVENIRRVVVKNGGEIDYLFRDGKLIIEMCFEG